MSRLQPLDIRRKSGYLPSLDGWRALAILAVIMNNDLPWEAFGRSNVQLRQYGGWGVYLFFAISGILICGRILDDERKSGRINLKAFYIRRLLRIQPAAFCYLAAIALLIFFGVIHESWRAWRSALFLYTNFIWHASDTSGRLVFVGHFWTLAVEEHFYILLSLLLFTFRRNRLAIFSSCVAVLLLAQAYAAHIGLFSLDVSPRRTFWVLQFLLIPSLVALLLRITPTRTLAERFVRPWVVFSATFMLAFLHQLQNTDLAHWHRYFLAQQSRIILYSLTAWVVATMLHPRSLTTRFLELAPLRFLGRLSYSVYLWHVLFFVPVYRELGVTFPLLLFLSGRPWKYLATLGMSLLSYYFVEKPFIRLGHRLAPPATPGHSDLAVDSPIAPGSSPCEPFPSNAHPTGFTR